MENQNSKITEAYKAEVSDILLKISESLSEKVTNNLNYQLSSFNQKLDDFNNLAQKIVSDSKNTTLNTSNTLQKIIDTLSEFNNKIYTDNLKQADRINALQVILTENLETNANYTNKYLVEIKKSLNDSNNRIENQSLALKEINISNKNLIETTGQSVEKNLTKELVHLSKRLEKIENDNEVLILIEKIHAKQEKLDKMTVILLLIIVVIFAFLIFNFFINK